MSPQPMSTPVLDPTSAPVEPAPARRRPRLRWPIGVVVVVGLITVVVLLFTGAATNARADDPRSTLASGNAALAQLLSDEGVRLHATSDVDDAVRRSTATSTLVVANADLLSEQEAGRLARTAHARLVLLRPTSFGLSSFGAAASTVGGPDELTAGCADPAAVAAARVTMTDRRTYYQSSAAPALACFPTGAGGFGYLRVDAATGPLDLVAGGTSNGVLGEAGNAAFAMRVFGSQPDVVWLVGVRSGDGTATTTSRPTLLPPWWGFAVAQAVLAIAVVGIWRGRRLGPIMVEPLPVRVRASETVEGHGRLYYRIGARDRAAEALRAGTRSRLGRVFGHSSDPHALAVAVAQRTGQPERVVIDLLAGPPPVGDDALLALATALDQLESDARTT